VLKGAAAVRATCSDCAAVSHVVYGNVGEGESGQT